MTLACLLKREGSARRLFESVKAFTRELELQAGKSRIDDPIGEALLDSV